MQTRKLGNSDLNLTAVGLGTWAIGGPWQFGWGPQDAHEAIAAIVRASELGINWLDTAPIYGCGHSEELVGRALKQIKSRPIIATKCSLLWNEKREKVGCLKAQSIRKECEDSLTRLGVEVIDLYQMHWPDPESDLEEGWGEMACLQKQGKVRFIGVCNYNTAQLDRIRKVAPVTSLQPPYSMLKRGVESELLGYCKKHNIGVLAYSPMQRGMLTGKFNKQYLKTLAPDDHRLRMPEFTEPAFSANIELVEKLKPIAERNGRTVAQLAIAWVLRRPEVTAAIVGARKPSQIEETASSFGLADGETSPAALRRGGPAGDPSLPKGLAGASWKLSKIDIDEIEKLLAERQAKL